jgi:oxygen-independent coproporphyrinogen-3 oxidase
MIAVDPATETLPPAAPETDLDFALLQKYDRRGPRYTSYPTAPQFTTAIAPADLLAALAADGRDSSHPVSLYFHLPFCESRCWFCGCTTVITRRTNLADAYLDTLEPELACLAYLGAGGPARYSRTV